MAFDFKLPGSNMGGIPWGQNPMITALGASLLMGGGDPRMASQSFGQIAPAAMASGVAMRRDQKEQAQQEQMKQMWNAALIAKSQGKPIPPEVQTALFSANPQLGMSWLFPDKPTPYTDLAKANSDLASGQITQDQFQQMTGPKPADPASIANQTAMRKETEGKPGRSRYSETQPILTSMIKSVDDKSAMSDLQFIYGMAKIMDPTSVVRESEMGLVLQGQSLPQWVSGLYDKTLKGEQFLSPQARRDLVRTSMVRVEEFRKQAMSEGEFMSGVSQRQGIDPQNIVQPLSPMPAWASTAGVPSAMGAPTPPPTVVPYTEYFK